MRFALLKNPVFLFLTRLFVLYILWYFIYELWLHPKQSLDLFVVDITIRISSFILQLLGYDVFLGHRLIGINGTNGLMVGDPCNGIALFAIFSAFIIAFPGPIIKKIIFIPLGILAIQLLNVLRIVALAIIEIYSYELTELNHTYTFTIIIYTCIFLLWMLWVRNLKKSSPELQQS